MILKTPTARMTTNTMHLSSVDQRCVRVYTPTLLLFPFPDGNQAEAAIAALSDGLRETLTRFPFLAGTLRLQNSGKLILMYPTTITDPTESAIFAKKFMPSTADFPYTYEELTKEGMPPSAFKPEIFCPDDLLRYPDMPPNAEGIVQTSNEAGIPVIRVQANFIAGGLVLSMYFHHAVMDCSGISTFWKWYAHNVSALNHFPAGMIADSQVLGTPPDQSQMRLDLDARTPAPSHKNQPTADSYVRGAYTYPYPKTLKEDAPCSLKYFVFSADRICAFRKKIKSHFARTSPPSMCNVLAALVWIYVTRARAARVADCGQEVTNIGIATDLRRRMEPKLGPDYMGNLAIFSKGSMKIADFIEEEQVSEQTIVNTVRQVNRTISNVNNDWVQRHLGFFKSIEEITDNECALAFRFGFDIYLSSWMNFGADIKWGIPGTDLNARSLQGRPEIIRRTYGPSDGGIQIMPRSCELMDGKAPYEVMVRLATVDMETLLNEKGGLASWAERIVE